MKVVLLVDVPNLGEANALANVAPGYARNFLIPNKLAVPADRGAVKDIEKRKKALEQKLAKEKLVQEEIKSRVEAMSFAVEVEAGENGKLFGAVTAQNIADLISETAGISVDKKKVTLDEPLKTLGEHEVTIDLHPQVKAKAKILLKAK